ncbi:DUF4417 domain-containing protein [Crocosphaera sp. UHCC 0190]|uniref:DUF4417 domain-containing protein n=1 Tax=Crocosphaera sp. UHCC 0190 TaxID=3110246 RepID=UPI002B2188EF|nr:DUF4417 domain-containing protein [Crocosphaera sp. UHCC 0190]MEA5511839.1 DUF4417 domain-containing protein [Crocosphaera sp. UHCC 0190]
MQLNTIPAFRSTKLGMPMIEPSQFIPSNLQAYRSRKRTSQKSTLHFFIDDYRFESLWKFPYRHLSYLKRFEGVISPDFSLYLDYPTPVKMFNIYRNRWLTALWQSMEINVIPCVSWAEQDSFEYCFDGLPLNSNLALATMGIRKSDDSQQFFIQGVEELIKRLSPNKIIVYGQRLEQELTAISDKFIFYPHYKEKLRHGR